MFALSGNIGTAIQKSKSLNTYKKGNLQIKLAFSETSSMFAPVVDYAWSTKK
jgi:hypothetical protein